MPANQFPASYDKFTGLDTKTLVAGPYQGNIDPEATWNRRVYVTSLTPSYYKEKHESHASGRDWDVWLNVEVRGTVFSTEDGESDNGRITQLEALDMKYPMITDAINRCNAWIGAHGTSDGYCPL